MSMDPDRRTAYLKRLGVTPLSYNLSPAATGAPVGQPNLSDTSNLESLESVRFEPDSAEAILALGWEELEQRVSTCEACELSRGRTQTVFGTGSRNARLVVVGEAPGAEEDLRGEPFVGRAGQLLDQMLAAVGLRRQDVYICNIVKCRPPGNRNPTAEEASACAPYLRRQLQLLEPELILAVGRVAAQNLLQVASSIGALRGRMHPLPQDYGTDGSVPVIVTYHPAYLLRSPEDKGKAWQDLKLVMQQLRGKSL
ncbi:MAG: uracil-DNA glycosylase [Pseudomonadota bacterium]|nr:uracil-DNA glycosylase [Pseudomonadota bacterium]